MVSSFLEDEWRALHSPQCARTYWKPCARIRAQSRSQCSTVYKSTPSYQRPFTRLSQYRHVPPRSPSREGSPQWITEDELVYLSPFNCLSHGEKDRLEYPEHSVLVASTAPWAIRILGESVGALMEWFGRLSFVEGFRDEQGAPL